MFVRQSNQKKEKYEVLFNEIMNHYFGILYSSSCNVITNIDADCFVGAV